LPSAAARFTKKQFGEVWLSLDDAKAIIDGVVAMLPQTRLIEERRAKELVAFLKTPSIEALDALFPNGCMVLTRRGMSVASLPKAGPVKYQNALASIGVAHTVERGRMLGVECKGLSWVLGPVWPAGWKVIRGQEWKPWPHRRHAA